MGHLRGLTKYLGQLIALQSINSFDSCQAHPLPISAVCVNAYLSVQSHQPAFYSVRDFFIVHS